MRLWSAMLLTLTLLAVSPAQKSGSINAAQYYERGMNALLGTGVSRSDQTALHLLKTSAELGHLPAQTVVGYFYDTGTLVASEPGQAVEWYQKAANQGDPLGAWLLGRLYCTGSGVGPDLSRAGPLFQNAAGQGDAFGQYFLGVVKLDRQEYAKAAASFRQAAEQGLPQAHFQLGALLKDGKGVGQDRFEAYVWLLVSLNAGNQAASSDVAFLEGDLGSTQVERLRVERANWRLRRAALWRRMGAPYGLENSMRCRGRRLRICSGSAGKARLPFFLDPWTSTSSAAQSKDP